MGTQEGKLPDKQREIKHIHHAAVKKRGIMINNPIKSGIDNITKGTCKYQGHVHD